MAQESSSTQKKVWESVDLYAVRCFVCHKWRIIPSKEKYEEIRENIGQKYFLCDRACEWLPNVSCEDESDIKEDNNLIWAMDKPNIPGTPPGWQRIVRLRGEGGTRFADVFYVSPSNKRLRSMIEVEWYLQSRQDQSVSTSQFSCQTPVPLDENYVAKHGSVLAFSELHSVEVNQAVSMDDLENVEATAEVDASESEVNVSTTATKDD